MHVSMTALDHLDMPSTAVTQRQRHELHALPRVSPLSGAELRALWGEDRISRKQMPTRERRPKKGETPAVTPPAPPPAPPPPPPPAKTPTVLAPKEPQVYVALRIRRGDLEFTTKEVPVSELDTLLEAMKALGRAL
jgi:hypothetical protein